ncbi:CotH protein [Rubripirellula lacrimiformis]|uniref:CotH protein n=1 Tax=Rubripirellula lacrimiformis TaxID=1930273 RepID=A0A517N750_9BACT|nr:DUF4347 domain-containing protein [Rubripirellula lacrimiformis]QDT02979.1 CotH protein [Rubripirellula lacrimiformis]
MSLRKLVSRSSRESRRQRLGWSLAALEPRILLAADAGVAVEAVGSDSGQMVAATSGQMAAGDGQTDVDGVATTATQLVFIDSSVQDLEQLAGGLLDHHELILLDADRGGIDQISEALAGRDHVQGIHIVSHGRAGQIQLGNQTVDRSVLLQMRDQIAGWSDSLSAGADILLYGCDTGAGIDGLEFVTEWSRLAGADVAASVDRTGNRQSNADWDLERHVGMIESSLAFSTDTLSSYSSTLPISIRAAGQRGEEQMSLQIDGTTVATWDNVGGNVDNDEFLTFTYDADGIDADQIRVSFTNDWYQPENGIDRNLRVDSITVDGVTYQSESSEVFSTGTWKSADGITPGFRESEMLHSNGYFQYAGSSDPVDPVDGAFAIINEIHYNPGPDGEVDGDAEFLELYNPGNEDYDLSGMSFTGFDLTFADGTILAAGQYAIVAPSTSLAEAQWGVTPIAEFADGGLSGGGETIQLIAADGVTVVDEVSYDDNSPWPGSPDGNGPSLELVNPSFDNSDPVNWRGSTDAPTPAARNSVYSEVAVGKITDIVVTPGQPLPDQAFTVSATIPDATFATLTFKVMFGSDQTVGMTNVGGDVWEATVPGQEAGTLVRYRIDSDVAIAPFEGDTINYLGVVVSPTDIVGNTLPVFQFFVDQDEFNELTTTELALTNNKISAVVAYGGEVYDNATVRVRGGDYSRTYFDKKSLKFELPDGYTIDIGDEGSYGIDEFGINADFGDWTVVTPDLSWDVFNAETDSFTSSFFTRVEMNSGFHGLFRFQELYDGQWRAANGLAEAEFYKAGDGGFGSYPKFDKKNPDDGDYSSILTINDVLISSPSAAKTAWLYENVDVSNAINHMAISSLMRHDDQKSQNFYMALDPETQRWSIVEWDVDRTWRELGDETTGPFTTPEPIGHELMDSMWDVPEFQDMYWRRIQTLADRYLGTDQLIDRRAEVIQQIGATNSTLEFQKWGRSDIYSSQYWVDDWQTSIDTRRANFAAESRMPGSATGTANVVINELHYNPADDDAEFIELFNDSSESVDLSGWSIDGIDLTIDFGTVLLPNQYVVFTDNYLQFQDQYGGNTFVAGQYSGGLSGGGETITLLDSVGNVIDLVTYDDAAPWPTEPDGDGMSLSLVDPALDNSIAENWFASAESGGTPGVANDGVVAGETTNISIFAAGESTNEIIELEIAGVVVATYDIGLQGGSIGDYQSRNFIELTYEAAGAVAAADIRINFVNDRYEPENGIDYNVRIDRIQVNSVNYQTESANVYSTGTWLAADGIVPGFRLSETLHSNGYFQFDALAGLA